VSDEGKKVLYCRHLANKVWEKPDDSTCDSSQSRIVWIRRHLIKYFVENDRRRFEERLERKLKYLVEKQV